MGKKTAELAEMIRAQDQGDEGASRLQGEFDESMERLSVSRFRFCLLIFLILFPLLSFIDFWTRGTPFSAPSWSVRLLIEMVLLVYMGLTVIRQFQRSVYAFAFMLGIFIGLYNLLLVIFEGQAAADQYVVYALIFSIMGVVMPWGGRSLIGICLPIFLFYPVGITIAGFPMTGNFFLKSNLYLIFFMTIVAVGASINHKFRLQEFLLKKRMEGVNLVLEDYQKRLKRSYERMENVAIIDHLTGVYNRTYLTQWLTSEIHKKKSAFRVFSVVMYDFDRFKEINDLAGHQMGDRTLQRVTEIVQEELDGGCPIFRYGGDEFCVILPGFELARAVKLADRIRRHVETHPDLLIKLSPTESFHITLSLGVITEFVTGQIDADYLIRWVDAALLESKRQGRNCIHVFDPEERKIKSGSLWLDSAEE